MSSNSRDISTRRSCLRWAAAGALTAFAPGLSRAGCPCGDDAEAKPQATVAKAAPPAQQQQDAPPLTVLRVCADPDDLPFSNRKLEGFENKIADIVARDLGVKLEYQWLPQRLGFYREALKNGDANLVMAAPAGFERALTTTPYYRSSYAFVFRRDGGRRYESFDDAGLRTAKIGVQLTGGVNTPPTYALARRKLVDNVTGYPVFEGNDEGGPAAKIVGAVASGEVDVAVVWGPAAGFFAQRHPGLEVVPVSPQEDPPALSFGFDICMGVRRKDKALRDRINEVIVKRRTEIDAILAEYGVPRVPPGKAAAAEKKD